MPLLQLQGIRRTFPVSGEADRTVLDGLDLELAAGESVALVGRSGAGKTTLARLAVGLDRPDRGRVVVDGVDLAAATASARRAAIRRVHLVFQDPYDALAPFMTVAEIVAEPLVIDGVPRRERDIAVRTALEEVALHPVDRFIQAHPHELSGGERQRVALARAIVRRPVLLVADEPTSMVDAPLRRGLLALIDRLRTCHGMALLHVTHDPDFARSADRLLVLVDGRLEERRSVAG